MKRRRRQRNNAKARAATSVEDVPDDLLELILLHLDSPVWLIRAASTCKRWRGVIAAGDGGGAFLRRASSLHPPTVVGHYRARPIRNMTSTFEFIPTSPPAPVAKSRFCPGNFGPLDDTSSWDVTDVHAGLVLVCQRCCSPPDIIVCDPLTGQFQRTSRGTRAQRRRGGRILKDAFLLDDGEDGDISTSNFRVLCRFVDGQRARVLSFTNGGEDWRLLSAVTWRVHQDIVSMGHLAGRVDGSLYMGSPSGGMVVLDNTTLEFSMVDLPSHAKAEHVHGFSKFLVIPCAGGDGSTCSPPPEPRIVHVKGEELEVFRRVHGEWVLEHSIRRLSTRLPSYPEKHCRVGDVVAGGIGSLIVVIYITGNWRWWCFSVSLDTMELTLVPESTYQRLKTAGFAYTLPWPKFMRACLGCAEP